MKILIVTQAVDQDSPTLGFFIEWLREFSKQCERVEVIALRVGQYDLPGNVRVVSMGKERGFSRPRRLLEYWRWLWRLLPECDGVFAHMCPEYVIAGWPLFLARRKVVALWYAHRSVTFRLRLACRMAGAVLSIAPGSIDVPGITPRFLGHGIPTDLFAPGSERAQGLKLLSVGRITPIKRIELMIEAVAALRTSGTLVTLTLVGEPGSDADRAYSEHLRSMTKQLGLGDSINFAGAMTYARMPEAYRACVLHLNAAPTGALDKAVLEAMSCGVASIVMNDSFRPVFGLDADLLIAPADATGLVVKVGELLSHPRAGLGERLRTTVIEKHSLKRLIAAILPHLRSQAIATN